MDTHAAATTLPWAPAPDDRRAGQWGLVGACVLFTALFLATFPAMRTPPPPPPKEPDVPPLHWLTAPIPTVPRPPETVRPERVRRVALPDPPVLVADPVAEPHAEPHADLPPETVTLRGPPRSPPSRSLESPVLEGTAGLIPPRLVHAPQPAYPAAAKRFGAEGEVAIRAIIGRDGRVRQASIERSSGRHDLDAAAREAVLVRRYVPGRLEGRVVEVVLEVTVRFQLR